MSFVSHVMEAARPKTLPACAAPVLLGTAVAHQQGHAHWPIALLALLCAFSLQLSTNFANDYFDAKNGADTDARVGPRRAVAAGLITPSQMKWLMAAAFSAALVFGLMLVKLSDWRLLLVGIACLLAAYFYTGGKRPWGYIGLGDILVFVFFGLVAVVGTVFVQGGRMDLTAFACGASAGLLSTAILVVNNLRDRHTDVAANKKTLAVRFGAGFARAEHGVCMFAPFAIATGLAWLHAQPWLLLPWLVVPLAVRVHRQVRAAEGPALNPLLAKTAQVLLLFCVVQAVALVL
jgi:1,4-dihydroxy-2-naphthoate polyprenyltransferase